MSEKSKVPYLQNKKAPSILKNKYYQEQSIFLPESLLREARRQKDVKECSVPSVCVLDPDGDLAQYLISKGAEKHPCWACYHSYLYSYSLNGIEIGIIPYAVGAPYAVLVAEQLFVSGCKLLISITSAGIVKQTEENKNFALLTGSIRDEGTSYHYLPPEKSATLSDSLHKVLTEQEDGKELKWFAAKTWTTDAPYRETKSAIQEMVSKDITCVEMETAALYAFAEYKNKQVICFAHLTNTMAQNEQDFEKGEQFGSIESLELVKEVLERIGIVD